MNNVIRSVLHLPADLPWPTDHFTLLGLTESETSPERVESAVMERMGSLRNYQLAHPDEVTEAMNCLARAMVELIRPKPKAQSLDSQQAGVVAATPHVEPVESRTALTIAPEAPATVDAPVALKSEAGSPQGIKPDAPLLELLPESYVFPSEPMPVRLPFEELRKSEPLAARAPNWKEYSPPAQQLADVPRPYPVAPGSRRAARSSRRDAIRVATRYRRLLRAWDAAGTFLGQPEIVAMTRAESIAVLIALGEIESSRWALSEAGPGGSVLSLARNWPNVGAMWELSYAVRESLRDDWLAGRLHLLEKYARCCQTARRHNPCRDIRRQWLKLRYMLPHYISVAACGMAIFIGLVRQFT